MFLDANGEDDPLFFALRGIKIDPDDRSKLIVPLRCHWLTEHNKCKIYARRPKSCSCYQCDNLKEMDRLFKYEAQTKDDRKTT
jgi:Fe-S-cluster containining protein